MKISTFFIKSVIVSVFCGIGFTAGAQKLPNIQQASVYAPANIKIDGKANEWDYQFQAFNNANEIFYTISNDTENLYFIAHAKESAVIQKIIYGGITLTLKSIVKKSQVIPISITYPLAPVPYNMMSGATLRNPNTLTDSAVIAFNKQISDHIKTIPITGIKAIPDSSVSVYNDQGIKAVQFVDNKKTYVYELAVPLKYLRQVVDDAGTFSYSISVNGLDTKGRIVIGGHSINEPVTETLPHNTPDFMTSPTYCKGEYTLAKK